MKHKIFYTIFLLFLFGCATTPIITKKKDNWLEVSRIGVASKQNDNGDIVIIDLAPNGPAEKSGIKKGDVILTLDGKKLIKDSEFVTVMNNKNKGDHVLIEIKRNEQILSYDIKPTIIKIPPTVFKIGELLDNEKKVSLVIVVSEVKNSMPQNSNDQIKSWEDSVRNNWQSKIEGVFINMFGNDKNFSIIDRSRLKNILDEFQFNLTGFVSDKLRAKIGEMTGATHLIDINISRFSSGYSGFIDITNVRLIEIETGKVLAVDTSETTMSNPF